MTNQAAANSLDVSLARIYTFRLCALALMGMFGAGAASLSGYAQAQPDTAKAPQQVVEKKPAADPNRKVIGGYLVHQQIELGGRIVAGKSGSNPMWSTMINQGTGMRVLNHSLEMRSLDPTKTPFFDTLTSSSFGYGGDPNDVSYLNVSKGRWYSFAGSFRRDRNYFDYNLLDNSLLSTATTATPVLVPEPDSLHLFNTVRRNTDTMLTILPLSVIDFRAGFNHNMHEGPTYSTVHYAGDVQVAELFRNGTSTYVAGVDWKPFKRTTVSFDELLVFYKGDSRFQLAPTPFKLSDGTPASLGVDVLTGPTVACGTGANKTENVINGVVNPFCSGTEVASSTAPIRTAFPTEQLRFSSHYWNKVSFNGRLVYSGATSNVNNFNQTFTGWNTRTSIRQEVETGGMPDGRLATNKRANGSADFGLIADLNKYVTISDALDIFNTRNSGNSIMNTVAWQGPAGTSMLTPVNSITPCTPGPGTCPASPAPNSYFLDQKVERNTVLAEIAPLQQIKFTGGWRFVNRNIVDPGDDLTWHQNWALLGAAIQPTRMVRLNLNYEGMSSKSADANTTPSNTYTREAPDKIFHLRARAVIKPAKWVNFALTGNDYSAKNDDPLVNHQEHNHDFSFATQVIPTEALSLDFNFAHDDVFSETDLCYAFTPNANAPLPVGASNAGTCTVANSGAGVGDPSYYLDSGMYHAPTTFFAGSLSYAPSKYFKFNGGARVTSNNGQAEMLNPLMVPGALRSKVVSPYSDLTVNVARQWAWHGFWEHNGYDEAGGPGPAARNFHGDVITLGVQYAF
ncbi:MAG TPA: hypothetical protein VK716_17245 [Terracidiphilus sp.]|jgi:hypothetical protein|nr:hypothetical protein [Terracidiphilus sp.]